MSEDQLQHHSSYKAHFNLQWVNHLLDADPHNLNLWIEKAIYFRDAKQGTIPNITLLERVLLCYQQCIRKDPTNWVHYYHAAKVLKELNHFEEALGFCQKAVELKPDNRYVQELLVATLFRLGMERQGVEAYKQAAEHGIELNPEILDMFGERVKRTADFTPSIQELYRNPESAKEKILQAEVIDWLEAGDPELYTLQFELEELRTLGLSKAAEELCINFSLTHGMNNLTQSFLFLKDLRDPRRLVGQLPDAFKEELSAAYPLLELSKNNNLRFLHLGIVDSRFEEDEARRFITPQEVIDFDDQARWYMQHLTNSDFAINDPAYLDTPYPSDLSQVWEMVHLNFIVACKLDRPTLIAYTATTLAEFYDRLEAPNLPFILYTIAADAAEKDHQWNYFAKAQRNCAMILKNKGQIGSAVNHLKKPLQCIETLQPMNQFDIYYTLAECYSHLNDLEQARQCCNKALAVQNVPEARTEQAHQALKGVDAMIAAGVGQVSHPPVLCQGLEIQHITIETPPGPYVLFYTSKHELYDSLLQVFDNIYRVRQSLLEREAGYTYFQGYPQLMDMLVRTALELELPGNALMHLEMQKSLILTNRLKYLLRDKPADLPDSHWEDFQRLITIYRRLVESPDDLEADLEGLSVLTLHHVEDAISQKLWECSQISETGAKQIQQKLAFSKFPQKVECAEPESTLILEFCSEACFLIHPESPMNPEVIELPEATPEESERLVRELFGIVQEWPDHFYQSTSIATMPSSERFATFLMRFDKVFYQPIARRLDQGKVKRICIIPHRVLHVLPLNLLGLSEQPEGSLGERFIVSFAPSLAAVKSLGNLPHKKPERGLTVTNPVPRCPNKSCRNPDHNCFSIEKAEQETLTLQAHLNAHGVDVISLRGQNATLKAVSSELGLADIVHFATHGFFDPEHPENSGLLLSIPEDRADSQALYLLHNTTRSKRFESSTVGDILSLDYLWKNIDMFRCQLLNLSACFAAMVDKAERSDEFYGITNGFLYAGVQNIVSSLWKVHDLASQVFNLQFYEALLSDDYDPGHALKAAIRRLKEFELEGEKPFAHPLFWAGYRVIGFS